MLKKINYIFTRHQKRNICILFVIMFIGSFMELIGVSAIMPLVNIILDESVLTKRKSYIWIGEVLHLETPKEYILAFVVALIGIYVLKNMYIIFQNNMQYKFTYNNQRKLAMRMLDCYLRQDYLYHVSQNVGDLQRNVGSDTTSFYNTVLAMVQFMSEALVCLMLVLYLLYCDFAFTVGIILILGISFAVFVLLYRKFSVKWGIIIRQLSGLQNKWLIQAFTGIKEIKVMNKESYFLKNYDESYKRSTEALKKSAFLGYIPKPIIETLCIGGVLCTVAIQILCGLEMKKLIPLLSVFAVSAFRMLPSFNRLSSYMNTILIGKASVENIYLDLIEIKELLRNEKNTEKESYCFDLNKDIVLKDVSFKYPNSEKEVVRNISLKISPNKSVALIGPSGAGKTTLADIILGILVPQSGSVEAGGASIFDHIHSWHENLGYIPQMIFLMDDSIRNNVAFGITEEEIDDDGVWMALREAQLEDFVRELPEGLNTQIGDRGIKLSGGQRQRIGIARALYTDPKVLILDEATSALDNETETAVMEAIDSLHGSRTMIIIAHRLTTIRNCDVIYEVNDQTVVKRDKKEVLNF